jgi:hypothetical protein
MKWEGSTSKTWKRLNLSWLVGLLPQSGSGQCSVLALHPLCPCSISRICSVTCFSPWFFKYRQWWSMIAFYAQGKACASGLNDADIQSFIWD